MVTNSIEDLRRFMAPRSSVAGRLELVESGFDPSRIDGWVRNGRLVPILHGVYSLGRDVETRAAAWRAALIVAGPGSALSGRSACEAWRIVESFGDVIPKEVEIAVVSGNHRTLRGRSPALRNTTVSIVSRNIRPDEVWRLDDLRTVHPARALIDFSAQAAERQLRFAFLEACRLRLFGRANLQYCFARMSGRRGAGNLRLLLACWVPELGRVNSVLEGTFLLAWVARKLVMPKVNVWVEGYEVDFYWPELDLILELDGLAFHDDPLSRARDREKTRHLESKGKTVLRASFRDVESDPDQVIDTVLATMNELRSSQ